MRHRSEDAKEQTRRDGARAAADMHEEAVQPLKSEVSRMRQALVNLQGTYAQDVDQVCRSSDGVTGKAPAIRHTLGEAMGNVVLISDIPAAANRSKCHHPLLMLATSAAQVRHAAEDQVNGARQEAQRAIRDLQTAAYRLQVCHGSPFNFPLLHSCRLYKQLPDAF